MQEWREPLLHLYMFVLIIVSRFELKISISFTPLRNLGYRLTYRSTWEEWGNWRLKPRHVVGKDCSWIIIDPNVNPDIKSFDEIKLGLATRRDDGFHQVSESHINCLGFKRGSHRHDVNRVSTFYEETDDLQK